MLRGFLFWHSKPWGRALDGRELETINFPNFGTKVWSVESFFLSTLQTLALKFGASKFFFSLHSKSWQQDMECWELQPFGFAYLSIEHWKSKSFFSFWRFERYRGRNFTLGTQILVPKLSFVVLFQLNTPFWYPNHEWTCVSSVPKVAMKFPKKVFSNSMFDQWFHKVTFWSQVLLSTDLAFFQLQISD
jgi:hypothetical protein